MVWLSYSIMSSWHPSRPKSNVHILEPLNFSIIHSVGSEQLEWRKQARKQLLICSSVIFCQLNMVVLTGCMACKCSPRRIEMWGAKKSRLEIISSTFYYCIQGRNPTFVRGNWSRFEISLGAGWKSQLLGGMTYTVGNEFYALTWTFILVLNYFGKKNPKNQCCPT